MPQYERWILKDAYQYEHWFLDGELKTSPTLEDTWEFKREWLSVFQDYPLSWRGKKMSENWVFENLNSRHNDLSNTSIGFKRKFKSELEASEIRIYKKENPSRNPVFKYKKWVRIEFENLNSQRTSSQIDGNPAAWFSSNTLPG